MSEKDESEAQPESEVLQEASPLVSVPTDCADSPTTSLEAVLVPAPTTVLPTTDTSTVSALEQANDQSHVESAREIKSKPESAPDSCSKATVVLTDCTDSTVPKPVSAATKTTSSTLKVESASFEEKKAELVFFDDVAKAAKKEMSAAEMTPPLSEVRAEDIANSFQILSDIHTEFESTYENMVRVRRRSPIIALLGDIGYPKKKVYRQFLVEMAKLFERVLLLAGNHEFYNTADVDAMRYTVIPELVAAINEEVGARKVFFLDNSTVEFESILPGVRFVGTTLWVEYPKQVSLAFEYRINDFRKISILPTVKPMPKSSLAKQMSASESDSLSITLMSEEPRTRSPRLRSEEPPHVLKLGSMELTAVAMPISPKSSELIDLMKEKSAEISDTIELEEKKEETSYEKQKAEEPKAAKRSIDAHKSPSLMAPLSSSLKVPGSATLPLSVSTNESLADTSTTTAPLSKRASFSSSLRSRSRSIRLRTPSMANVTSAPSAIFRAVSRSIFSFVSPSSPKKVSPPPEVSERLLRCADVNAMHNAAVHFIEDELQRAAADGKYVVVLTHHAPTDYRCIFTGKGSKSKGNCPLVYVSNYSSLERLFREPLAAWCFGHTHFNCDYEVVTETGHRVRVATNQMGYLPIGRVADDYSDSKVVCLNHTLDLEQLASVSTKKKTDSLSAKESETVPLKVERCSEMKEQSAADDCRPWHSVRMDELLKETHDKDLLIPEEYFRSGLSDVSGGKSGCCPKCCLLM